MGNSTPSAPLVADRVWDLRWIRSEQNSVQHLNLPTLSNTSFAMAFSSCFDIFYKFCLDILTRVFERRSNSRAAEAQQSLPDDQSEEGVGSVRDFKSRGFRTIVANILTLIVFSFRIIKLIILGKPTCLTTIKVVSFVDYVYMSSIR